MFLHLHFTITIYNLLTEYLVKATLHESRNDPQENMTTHTYYISSHKYQYQERFFVILATLKQWIFTMIFLP